MKAKILLTLCILAYLQNFSQVEIKRSFYFDKDIDQLSQTEQTRLNSFIDSVKTEEIISLKIKGYCDKDGDIKYNQDLSDRRVQNSLKAITQQGEFPIDLQQGYGESKARAEFELEMRNDRRVDVTVQIKSHPIIVEEETQPLEELYALIRPKSQEFCIVPDQDTFLILKKGSMVYFPANAFEQNGKVITGKDNCIWVSIDEVMSTSDAVLYDLSTSSNNSAIESAGMINITAEYNDNPAQLRADQEMIVMLPTQKESVGNFQMFNGTEHDQDINWLVNNTPELSNVSLNDFWGCYGDFNSNRGARDNCKFFFCKIKRFFFPKRFATRRTSSFGSGSDIAINSGCGQLSDLFKKYKVDNVNDLMYEMNKTLMDKYNVKTLSELRVAMEEERKKNVMNDLESGNANLDDLRYMMFNTNDLGWANCDAFSDIKDKHKTEIIVDAGLSKNVDVKLVFKKRNIILSPTNIDDFFHFDMIPEGETATILAIKMVNHKPQIFVQDITIEKETFNANFKTVTVDQMKKVLNQLNT